MSRIGIRPIDIPSNVEFQMADRHAKATGKLGTLEMSVHDYVVVEQDGSRLTVKPRDGSRRARDMWATTRTQLANMIHGVANGFTKKLEIHGVGYRAQMKGNTLVLSLGLSHDVHFPVPEDLTITCEKPTLVAIHGASKQRVGQIAANLRGLRPPEPYKGKGVRYEGEKVILKEGKKK